MVRRISGGERLGHGRLSRFAAAWLMLVVGLATDSTVAQPAAPENDVKVAYLYNFARFVTWPATTNTTFSIGIMEPDALGDALGVLAQRSVRGRPVRIVDLSKTPRQRCDLVYLNGLSELDIRGALKALSGRPVLTVGDEHEFISWGGMVALWRKRERVQFDIHAGRVRGAGLTPSGQLLEVAATVRGGEP